MDYTLKLDTGNYKAAGVEIGKPRPEPKHHTLHCEMPDLSKYRGGYDVGVSANAGGLGGTVEGT